MSERASLRIVERMRPIGKRGNRLRLWHRRAGFFETRDDDEAINARNKCHHGK